MTGQVGGGSSDRVARGLPTGGQGSKVYVLCPEPKEYKHFRPGTRPGGSVTGVTEKLFFMCQIFMCLFPAPIKVRRKVVRYLPKFVPRRPCFQDEPNLQVQVTEKKVLGISDRSRDTLASLFTNTRKLPCCLVDMVGIVGCVELYPLLAHVCLLA